MSVLSNWGYRFNAVSANIPESYFMDIDKLILKFICRGKRPKIINTLLKENKVRRLTLPNFKIYCKTMVIKECVIGERTEKKINETE